MTDSTVEAAFNSGGALTVLNAGWRKARFNLPAEGIASDGFDDEGVPHGALTPIDGGYSIY